jgi:hypothetical protein
VRVAVLLDSELEETLIRRQLEASGHSVLPRADWSVDAPSLRDANAVVLSFSPTLRLRATVLSELASRGAILVVRTHLGDSDRRRLVELATLQPALRVLVGECDSKRLLGSVCVRLLESEAGPIGPALRVLRDHVVAPAGDVLVSALLLGASRNGVAQLAGTLSRSPRSIQLAIQRRSMPRAHRLLAWGRLLWFSWRMRLQRCSIKQAVYQSGYADPRMLAQTSRRLSSGRLGELSDESSTDSILAALDRELRHRPGRDAGDASATLSVGQFLSSPRGSAYPFPPGS